MKNEKWKVHYDWEEENDEFDIHSYTITLNEKYRGWNTDNASARYGLPKELAQWICDKLNSIDEEIPFIMKDGCWKKIGISDYE